MTYSTFRLRLFCTRLLLLAGLVSSASAADSGAALTEAAEDLPPVFQQPKEYTRHSVLSDVRRPSQDLMEKAEDIVIGVANFTIRFFHEISLKNLVLDGTEAHLQGRLTEQFFENATRHETDVVFLREAFSRLHLRYCGSNIVGKWMPSDPKFLQTKEITVDVRRRIDVASGNRPAITYKMSLSFRNGRTSEKGVWHDWSGEPISAGTFEIVVFPFLDEKDRLIYDGKLERKILQEFGFVPFRYSELPRAPLYERFPLLQRLSGITSTNRVAALKRLANANDAEAQYLLARAFERGTDVAQNWQEAAQWHSRSAAQKFDPAAYRLGDLYLAGTGVPAEPAKARSILNEAANRGHVPSLALLGKLMLEGVGGAQDVKKGGAYVEYAAQQGDALALYTLAERALAGTQISTNETKHIDFLQQAANRRCPEAALLLGNLHQSGRGVEQNTIQAWGWYRMAAKWATDPKHRSVQTGALQALLKLRDTMSEEEIEKAISSAWEPVALAAASVEEP